MVEKEPNETPEQFVERVFDTFSASRQFSPHFSALVSEADSWGFPTWTAGLAAATKRSTGEFGSQQIDEPDEAFVRRILRALVQAGSGAQYVNHVESLLSDMEGFQGPGIKVLTALRRAAKQRRQLASNAGG
jgi:hypothetical protein